MTIISQTKMSQVAVLLFFFNFIYGDFYLINSYRTNRDCNNTGVKDTRRYRD